ncbi:MAG: hypothetical protein J6B87_07295 [Clostridia bacterium]|nr:hypothetical protein [Clostridia bacterium]
MDEKKMTYFEIKKIIYDVMEPYKILFANGSMSFSEVTLIENVLLKIDYKFQEKLMEDDKND